MGKEGINWSTLGNVWNSMDMRDPAIKAEVWSSGWNGKNRDGGLMEFVLGNQFKVQSRIFLMSE